MTTELYCRLYVNSVDDEDALRRRIAEYFGGTVAMRNIYDEFLHIRLSKNDTYSSNSLNDHGGFVHFPYTAEVHPRHEIVEDIEPVDTEIYLDLVCHIIKELRKSDAQVVASCDYEDLIAEKTGWNWSEKTPHHPVLL
jgi:hypothetical protein